MTRWSAITRTRRSCSALAYGSRSTAAAEKTSTGSYTTSGDATEPGEGWFVADAAGVGPGEQQLCGGERADAWLVEQVRCELAGQAGDLGFELAGFAGQVLAGGPQAVFGFGRPPPRDGNWATPGL
jgi:hypothetical protein